MARLMFNSIHMRWEANVEGTKRKTSVVRDCMFEICIEIGQAYGL